MASIQFLGPVPDALREAGVDGILDAARAARGMTVGDLSARIAATDSAIPAALLTQRIAAVFTKPYPENDALKAFGELPADMRTPLGADAIEYAQVDHSGEIGLLDKGAGQANIPTNGVPGVVTDLRKPAYFGSVVKLSLREQQNISFLGDGRIDSVTSRIDAARNIHLRRDFGVGGFAWVGYPGALGPFGLYNHPGIAKVIRSIPYVAASGGQAIVQDVGDAIQYLTTATNSVAKTRKVVIAQKLWSNLTSLTYSSQIGDTLWKLIQTNNPDITFEVVQSLNDAGPNGEHGMVCIDTDYRGAAGLDIIAPPTILPVQRQGFDDMYYMFHASGGFKSVERFGIVVQWVPAS